MTGLINLSLKNYEKAQDNMLYLKHGKAFLHLLVYPDFFLFLFPEAAETSILFHD